MQNALSLLPGYSDYYAFCKSPEKQDHTLCNVTSAKIFSGPEGNKLRIQITSNRFVRGMIRALVAKLLKAGNGEKSVGDFEQLLISKQSPTEIEFSPPQGLYLTKIKYPFLDLPARPEFMPFSIGTEEKEWQEV
jgi:tRNA pseudouridine38-40 synthase